MDFFLQALNQVLTISYQQTYRKGHLTGLVICTKKQNYRICLQILFQSLCILASNDYLGLLMIENFCCICKHRLFLSLKDNQPLLKFSRAFLNYHHQIMQTNRVKFQKGITNKNFNRYISSEESNFYIIVHRLAV